jgi:hypothetical protein
MSTSTAEAAVKQARPRTFQIIFMIEGVRYAVVPLQPDPGVASRAYRFVKRDARGRVTANYDVHVNGFGPECECKGYLRWRKPCKHILTLVAAGMIPPPAPSQPAPAPGHVCTVCRENPVDAEGGTDTCEGCLAKQ